MRVFIGSGCAAPQKLIEALAARAPELYDIEIIHILTFGAAPYAQRHLLDNFRHNAFFIGPNVRDAVNECIADYTPISLSDVPALMRRRALHIHAALIQVSPPDAHGYCSYGVSVDVVKAAVENADYIIAEINPNMPRTLGESFVHLSKIDAVIVSDAAILELAPEPITPEAAAIGAYIADLVEDGATLQTGIGIIPGAVMAALSGKKNLGMHTEMFTECILPLIENGVLNCSQKSLLPGKIVSSFCFGSRRLYDYIHNNPLFEFRPTEFTNDPFQIARNDKMVAISSAIEVDLTGQVCADSVGTRFYSGFGGQLDFMRGAAHSQGGKPIIALPSTTRNGKKSRISAMLQPGAGVVTTRADVHYVVTEYGVAYLHGKTIRERALALINIAHPDFREDLMRHARERHLVHPAQIALPRGLQPYPRQYESHHTFGHHLAVTFRPIKPTDEDLLKNLFYSHSQETILNRYLNVVRHLSHQQLQQFVTLDFSKDFALVGLIPFEGRERIVCVGRYFRDPGSSTAEFAITVRDEFQGKGLGAYLLSALQKIASENGIEEFHAGVLETNKSMLAVIHKLAPDMKSTVAGGIRHIRFKIAPAPALA
jgi:acyl-CoA hydrolase/GNAT superfamily N-acetyltransferase